MTDWLTASAMLLSGLIVGFMFVYAMRRSATAKSDSERLDLRAKLDALMLQLRELDTEGADSEERVRLEQAAATTLRQLEGVGAPVRSASTSRASAQPMPERMSATTGFILGALSMTVLFGLGYLVVQSSKPREANGSVTGGNLGAEPSSMAPAGTASSPSAPDPNDTTPALEASVREHPDDLSLRDDLAKSYLDHDKMIPAFDQTQIILKKDPKNSRGLTYQAIVRMAMGQGAEARGMLHTATEVDPGLLDAWVALAWVEMQSNQPDAAKKAIDEAIRRHPEEEARLREVFTKMRTPSSSPAAGAPEQAATTAASGPAVHITLTLAPGAKLPEQGFLFVLAREAGVTSGPPAAVKRLPIGAFPLAIDLSAADSMMGQGLPSKLRVEARIDSDGNPLTKDPTDASAVQDNVAVGTSVSLTLH